MTTVGRILRWSLLGLALTAGRAEAHAVLLASEPADRAVLATAPAEIRLQFDEPVQPIVLRMLDGEGRVVATGAGPAAMDLRLTLPPGLAAGPYVVSYRVTSADSHPVGGSILFAVGAEPEGWRAAGGDGAAEFWTKPSILVRAVDDAARLIAVGGALFLLLIARDRASMLSLRPLLLGAALVAIMTSGLGIGMQGGALAGGMASLLDSDVWRLGAGGPRGIASGIGAAGLALVMVGLRPNGRWRQPALGLGVVLALLPFPLVGHAAVAATRWIAWPAMLAHVALAAFWIGAFLPLLRALDHAPPMSASGAVRRFSTLAIVAVPLLILAGTVLALLRIDRPMALIESTYGQLLAAKLFLVAVLLALAAGNRWYLTPRLMAGELAAVRGLRATIRIEVLLAALVLVVSAWLGRTAPPASAPAPVILSATERMGRTASVRVSPAQAGRNAVEILLRDQAGHPIATRSVALLFALPSAGIEPIERDAAPAGEGRWRHVGPELAITGRWRLAVVALVDDFDQAVFEVDLVID
jgi:copper transport protein